MHTQALTETLFSITFNLVLHKTPCPQTEMGASVSQLNKWIKRIGVLVLLLQGWGCEGDLHQFAWDDGTTGGNTNIADCPLKEMVLLPGSDGPFLWGAAWDEPKLGDSYNWMLEAEFSQVPDLCVMAAPFPGREGFPYFEPEDPDNGHGFSYGDIESVQGSQVLSELGLRLMDFR
ncbi:MAG: hypothetical protein NUV84_00035, partial [Candidatus Uhrbacteria bacterium]|nr:hypothetical protein [Candidatus Uhrbacteria bacterium]